VGVQIEGNPYKSIACLLTVLGKGELQFRAGMFSIRNWQTFLCQVFCDGAQVFNDGWNGAVTAPLNIQLGMKFLF
jgi:hypothetical protein